jgi:hypothetical protein
MSTILHTRLAVLHAFLRPKQRIRSGKCRCTRPGNEEQWELCTLGRFLVSMDQADGSLLQDERSISHSYP